ncbi:unnamed protein product [Lactuca saligna]|uniref:Protein-tyrosine-phosphatase MKP1 C-terminal domain-containing protein n=1 Tax=Lactuca saligna TaxID=75948 RepID=A0AA36E073_LACSI|nr:unnamed protein product [Lactuca saligna]
MVVPAHGPSAIDSANLRSQVHVTVNKSSSSSLYFIKTDFDSNSLSLPLPPSIQRCFVYYRVVVEAMVLLIALTNSHPQRSCMEGKLKYMRETSRPSLLSEKGTSLCVYIAYIVDVVYIWVRRTSGEDDDNQWQIVGDDFIVRKGLATSSIVQIVREGQEPEQLWKHLHCFSFQNTGEKH